MSLEPNDDARSISATRLFDAPRELVFRMWTEPEHVRQWWGPRGFTNTIERMDVRPGGVWEFVMHGPDGTDYRNRIVYNEIVPPERIAYSHVNGPFFDATATFEEEGGKTRVTVRMTFATAELRDRIAREVGAVEGLEQTLTRLEEQLANEAAFTITRTFDAPRDLVFRVWTERDHLLQWWGPKGFTVAHCAIDLRPGGVMHFCLRGPHDMEMWARWLFREITAPRRLVFVSSFSDPGGGVTRAPFEDDWPLEILSTVTFEERANQTTITIQSAALNATAAQQQTFDTSHASMRGGWTGTFDQLAAYLEKART
jgi:uncharacterized protein YndB with AHSA1/START domain